MSKSWASFCSFAVLVLLGAVWWDSGYRLSWLSVDWTETTAVPFPVSRKIEIAARSQPFKRGSTSLLCGPDGTHVMLRTRLALPDDLRDTYRIAKGYPLRTTVIFDMRRVPGGVTIREFNVNSAIIALGSVDTALTAALTERDQTILADWFRRGTPQHMFMSVGEETSGHLESASSAKAVEEFLADCARKHRPPSADVL